MAYNNVSEGKLVVQRDGIKNAFDVASGVTIYNGTAVLLTGGKATYAVASGYVFAGVAGDTRDGKVDVYAEGVFRFAGSGLSASDIGKTAWLSAGSDGNPATILTTKPATEGDLQLAIGTIVGIDGTTGADVRITGYALKEAVGTAPAAG